jgi:hypothetical protein
MDSEQLHKQLNQEVFDKYSNHIFNDSKKIKFTFVLLEIYNYFSKNHPDIPNIIVGNFSDSTKDDYIINSNIHLLLLTDCYLSVKNIFNKDILIQSSSLLFYINYQKECNILFESNKTLLYCLECLVHISNNEICDMMLNNCLEYLNLDFKHRDIYLYVLTDVISNCYYNWSTSTQYFTSPQHRIIDKYTTSKHIYEFVSRFQTRMAKLSLQSLNIYIQLFTSVVEESEDNKLDIEYEC